jgi:hypothetical protein
MVPKFDIFCGSLPSDRSVWDGARWIESADSLDNAQQKMKHLADKVPGRYFVFCVDTNEVVASVDSTPLARAARR